MLPIPYVTSLESMIEKINDHLCYFVTFRVQTEGSIISNATIPFCRFRPVEGSEDSMIEARSCDCNGEICNHPTQRLYISKNQLENYVFFDRLQDVNLIFVYNV